MPPKKDKPPKGDLPPVPGQADEPIEAGGVEQSDQTGDGGARELEVETAIDRVGELANEIDLGEDQAGIVANATGFLVDLYKHKPKPWSALSQAEQRDLCAQLEHNATELVRQIVEAVARSGREAVRCLMVGFTDKGDDIKVELKVKALSKADAELAVLGLHRARGKLVLLTVASADEYAEQPVDDMSEPDQHGLGFEAGSDEHPEDDSDLDGAGQSDPADLRTGARSTFAGAAGTCRINLAKGWVQFLEDGEADLDVNWQDMREATPGELAAERERAADFAQA